MVEREHEFNPDFLKNMINRLDWDALVAAATTVCERASVRVVVRACVRACARAVHMRARACPFVLVPAEEEGGRGASCLRQQWAVTVRGRT